MRPYFWNLTWTKSEIAEAKAYQNSQIAKQIKT